MPLEFTILDFFQTLHTPIGDNVMKFITSLGDKGAVWIVMALALILIPKTRKTGLIVAAALILDAIFCNLLLKPLVARVRPYDVNTVIQLLVAAPKDYSFPSGHTAASFASAAALWFAKDRYLGKTGIILTTTLAVFIGLSRLYFYVHYPTDVLCGAILGILCGYFGKKLICRMYHNKNGYGTEDANISMKNK